MVKINKQPAPQGLTELYEKCKNENLSPDESYRKLTNPLKKDVINRLMAEQGHICAYCMRKIPDERELPADTPAVTIEHLIPRNPIDFIDVNQGLDYNNMVAVCSGNRGKKGTRKTRDLTCDAKRGSKDLKINPFNMTSIELIKYSETGTIFSDDSEIDDDLNITLNLNCKSDSVLLPDFRKAVLDEIQSEIFNYIEETEESFSQVCQIFLDMYNSETDPRTPYCGIIIWWLQEQLKNPR